MKDWKKIVVKENEKIINVIQVLNTFYQFVVVVDGKNKLVGTVTDGDIRRGLLKGINVNDSPVSAIMNENPYFATQEKALSEIIQQAKQRDVEINSVPIVSQNKELLKVLFLDEANHKYFENIPALIMAGGLGSRLGELTKDCPKPMLKINGTPMLEHIINNLKKHGVEQFFISVNYKSEVIENYFKNGEKLGVKIDYIREKKRMGTAGCLSLIDFDFKDLIVINGDVLSHLNFQSFYDFHHSQDGDATVCVREFIYQIPYGVVHTKDKKLLNIEEKPIHSFDVNAGIYIMKKSLISLIPTDEPLDMTSLLELGIKNNLKILTYKDDDYWLDIGKAEDYHKAQQEYK